MSDPTLPYPVWPKTVRAINLSNSNAMKTDALIPRPEEIELKLTLPASDPANLEKQLTEMPALARRKANHLHLHNTYYDTPDQMLRSKRMALRLRRMGSDAKPQWLQTLKMGGNGTSALSHRGEWETSVPGGELALSALQSTPWSDIDPDGDLFRELAPSFVTSFDRTSWTVRRRDGSVVEVSLDVGQIVVEGKSIPLCELELELLAGQPSALFGLAQQIACSIAVLPEHRSKAERGYALADDSLNLPLRAQPPSLSGKMSPSEAAQCVLREMFCQFTANLNTLRHSDDPEVIHQARVGWRRFKSAYRLFKPVLDVNAVPSWESLQTLLTVVGDLRDLDVARTETLPKFADAYIAGKATREEKWKALSQALMQSTDLQRKAVCYALEAPRVGATLLGITQWLEELPQGKALREASGVSEMSLRRWARRRIASLHKKFKVMRQDADTVERQHRVRILAKRMRYGIEALKPLLSGRRTKRWYQQATDLQTSIGMARDVVQANILVAKLETDHELTEFLRGVAAGQAHPG
ncbi:inorganic triphosphatase [soil metagenome]